MIVEHLAVGMFQCNCMIIGDETTREAIVVDPGDEADRILEVLDRHNLSAKWLLHTHAHLDHVMATGEVQERTGAQVCLHPDDLYLYDGLEMQSRMLGLPIPKTVPLDKQLQDDDTFAAGGIEMGTVHTPGHTPGSCCFLMPRAGEETVLFAGDTLFMGSIGRTDLPGGNYETLMGSIKHRLLPLDDATVVIPGHGPATTIHRERLSNPFLQDL